MTNTEALAPTSQTVDTDALLTLVRNAPRCRRTVSRRERAYQRRCAQRAAVFAAWSADELDFSTS